MTKPSADLVLVHGWASNPSVWAPVIPALSKRFRLTVVALPGCGTQNGPVPDQLEWLTAWLRDHTPQDAIWLAWSMGALPAFRLATGGTPHIARLNVIAGVVRFVKALDWAPGVDDSVLQGFHAGLDKDMAAQVAYFARLAMMPGGRHAAKAYYDRIQDGGGVGASALRAGLRILEASDVRESLERIQIPVTLFHGERDAVVDCRSSREASRLIPGAAACFMENMGHAPFWTHPKEFLSEFEANGQF